MIDISEYVKRVASRTAFKREFFIEKNLPTQPGAILAIPFFADLKSTIVMSSFLLNNFKQVSRDRYLILCSWPGLHGLFPYVDEYWSLTDNSALKSLASEANNFYNTSALATEIGRGVIEGFDVMMARDFQKFFNKGFTETFWQTFTEPQRFLPQVPSPTLVVGDFKSQMDRRSGNKIVVYPAAKMRSWQLGRSENLSISKEFWKTLIERLLSEGMVPVLYQNWFTHDMSPEFADRCIYLSPRNILDVLAAIRYVGCLLDIHSDISRLALAARCPFVGATERKIFIEDHDFAIDDLMADGLQHEYIFTFSTQLMVAGPDEWSVCLIDQLIKRLKEFFAAKVGGELPSANISSTDMCYDRVRERKARRCGKAFIKASKEK